MSDLFALFQRAVNAAGEASKQIAVTVKVAGNVRVADRPSMLHVRILSTGEIVEAVNTGGVADYIPGLQVEVRRGQDGVWRVEAPWAAAAQFTGGAAPASVPKHSHRLATGLRDYVEPLRFEPGLVRPYPESDGSYAFRAAVLPFMHRRGFFAGRVVDLAGCVPSAGQRWVLVGVNLGTNKVEVVKGNSSTASAPLSAEALGEMAKVYNGAALAGVLLRQGDTSANLFNRWRDCRSWFAGGLATIKRRAPAAGDDADAGYGAGSFWVDVAAGKAYICVDATPAAAEWRQIDEDIATMGAASASKAGTKGMVPPPAAGDQAKVLSGAGTWVEPNTGDGKVRIAAGDVAEFLGDKLSAGANVTIVEVETNGAKSLRISSSGGGGSGGGADILEVQVFS